MRFRRFCSHTPRIVALGNYIKSVHQRLNITNLTKMTDFLRSSSSEYVSYSAASSNAGHSEVGSMEECGCCCDEFPVEKIVECTDRHVFCFGCVRREVEEIIYGNYEARGHVPCMNTHGCKKPIPLSEIHRALPNDVIERYEERQAQDAIIEAKLENLVYCPFCGIPCEVDKCLQVMDCPNPKCLKASCIQCREPSHLPLLCEEVNEKICDTAHRTRVEVEERMTKAVVRECKTCRAKIVKSDGCNSVKCRRCRKTMCYVCEKKISDRNHRHFCHHSNRESGKPCKRCNKKCLLWGDEIEDDVALDAKEEALKELSEREPNLNLNLLGQNMGPPLVKQTQPFQLLGDVERLLRGPQPVEVDRKLVGQLLEISGHLLRRLEGAEGVVRGDRNLQRPRRPHSREVDLKFAGQRHELLGDLHRLLGGVDDPHANIDVQRLLRRFQQVKDERDIQRLLLK